MVSVGDPIRFDGFSGVCRAVVSTTDANGRGSIVYDGNTFQFRALRCPQVDGTDYPLVATSDPRFRAAVVQRDDNPLLFALAVDDGPAPDGAGMLVQGAGGIWAEAPFYSGQDSVIFVTGFYLKATIKKAGVAQASVLPDLEPIYSTSDGTQHAYFPPSPHKDTWGGQPDGCFITDANGLMLRSLPNATTEPVIIGRGVGALGHRAQDTWVSGPQSERLLSTLRVWYLGEYVDATPNGSVTLDVAACQLTITGPASANCIVQWEEGQLRLTPATIYTLDGGGSVVITGIPPGKYSVDIEHPTDNDKGLAKQQITLTNGQSGTVAFGASWSTVTAGWTQFYVYRSGGTALAGATLYQKIGPSGQEVYTAVATSGSDGSILIAGVGTGADDQIIQHDEWGAVCITWASSVQWINVTLAGRFSGLRSAQQGEYQEGIIPWGPNGNHPNLPVSEKAVYAQDTVTGEKFYFTEASGGYGAVSAPCPRGTIEGAFDPANWTVRQYNICSADGTVLLADQTLPGDTTGRWTDALTDRRQTTVGRLLTVVAGGKVSGNLVEYAPSQKITTADLTEAARQGLETGKWDIPLEARAISATLDAANGDRYLTFQSWSCSYCGAACWDRPDSGSYLRGYCPVCALNGYTVDLRTYFVTPTLPALTDWFLTTARNTTKGGHVRKRVPGWPRPEEYFESDSYKVDDWEGLGIPRWASVHIVLGTLAGGVFTDGESIAAAEARLGRTVGPCQLKLLLTTQYLGTGKRVWVTATRADNGESQVLTTTIPPNSPAGTIILLRPCPHHQYPSPSWFTDLLDASETWRPSQDYPLGPIASYEGVAVRDRCSTFVIRFWNQALGINDTDLLRAAMEDPDAVFPYPAASIPAGCSQTSSSNADAAPVGAILIYTAAGLTAHTGIVHRYQGGITKVVNSNHYGNGAGWVDLPTGFPGYTLLGWVSPPDPGSGYLACQIVNDGPAWRSSAGVAIESGAYSPYACDVLLQEWEPECRTDYMGRAHVVYNRDGGLYHRIWQVGQQAWGEAVCLTQRANWVTACQHHAFEIVGPVLLVTCESGGQRVWFRSTDSYGETWTYRSGNVAFSGLTNVQTTVDYMGRVWGVGLDTNGLLTAECTPDLGVTGYYRNAVDPSAADSEQPGLCIAGSTFILVTSQGGSLRTWVSKRGGEHWEQAPVVE